MRRSSDMTLQNLYRIEGGILNGTELQPFGAMLLVKYPHRKSKDVYIPPMSNPENEEQKTWHCCNPGCATPSFSGDFRTLMDHLLLHKGRLLKPWSRKAQAQAPLPAIRLPANEWERNAQKHPCATNEDRRFCLDLYITLLKRSLHRQGIEVIE